LNPEPQLLRAFSKHSIKQSIEEEVVVVEKGDCCTVIAKMARRKDEGKRGAP
jgi:hypothetical protein